MYVRYGFNPWICRILNSNHHEISIMGLWYHLKVTSRWIVDSKSMWYQLKVFLRGIFHRISAASVNRLWKETSNTNTLLKTCRLALIRWYLNMHVNIKIKEPIQHYRAICGDIYQHVVYNCYWCLRGVFISDL